MYIGYGSDLFEVDPTGTLTQVGVVSEDTLAVVGVQRSALTCFTCVSRSFCTHRNFVQKYLSTPQNEECLSPAKWTSQYLGSTLIYEVQQGYNSIHFYCERCI